MVGWLVELVVGDDRCVSFHFMSVFGGHYSIYFYIYPSSIISNPSGCWWWE